MKQPRDLETGRYIDTPTMKVEHLKANCRLTVPPEHWLAFPVQTGAKARRQRQIEAGTLQFHTR